MEWLALNGLTHTYLTMHAVHISHVLHEVEDVLFILLNSKIFAIHKISRCCLVMKSSPLFDYERWARS